MKKLLAPILALALGTIALLSLTMTAEAACSYNGYLNSGGKCSSSYNYKYDWDRNYQYQYQNQYYEYREQMILALIERLREMIRQLEQQMDGTTYPERADIDITTRTAINIEQHAATLRGRIEFDKDNEDARVYFEYGTSHNSLDKKTPEKTIRGDEDESDTFSADIEDLDDDRLYYFRAVGRDEDGDRDYGMILSFRTDSDSMSLPLVETEEVEDITEDRAEISGYVDMNDYENGRVFFVYGEDDNQVEDIADDYTEYSDIDEDGGNLQKVLVDDDLDGVGQYQKTITNLDSDTRIYYSICVEYEEGDDPEIRCGYTESFRTDEN